MKIGLLHHSAPPVVGGVETVLAQHARMLADDGHDVRVIAGRGDIFDHRVTFFPVPVVDSRHPVVLDVKSKLDIGEVPPEFDQLVQTVYEALRPVVKGLDVLIAHNVCSLNKNLALTAALRRLVEEPDMPRMLLWHHDIAWATPRYQPELHRGYPWNLLKSDWPNSTQVAVSVLRQEELATVSGIPLERIRVVPNGVDIPGFMRLDERTLPLIERAQLYEREPLLLLPVRITRRKNIELALHTMAALKVRLPDAALVITGPPGPHNPANAGYFEELLQLRTGLGLAESVIFLAEYSDEYLPNEVIADLYQLADALFMPSREEGFGIPILEAGLSGLAVFCTDILPLRELGGKMAAYFSPDAEPESVATLIADRLAANPIARLRARVRRHYRWESIYREHIVPLLETSP